MVIVYRRIRSSKQERVWSILWFSSPCPGCPEVHSVSPRSLLISCMNPNRKARRKECLPHTHHSPSPHRDPRKQAAAELPCCEWCSVVSGGVERQGNLPSLRNNIFFSPSSHDSPLNKSIHIRKHFMHYISSSISQTSCIMNLNEVRFWRQNPDLGVPIWGLEEDKLNHLTYDLNTVLTLSMCKEDLYHW